MTADDVSDPDSCCTCRAPAFKSDSSAKTRDVPPNDAMRANTSNLFIRILQTIRLPLHQARGVLENDARRAASAALRAGCQKLRLAVTRIKRGSMNNVGRSHRFWLEFVKVVVTP